jgi:hypothetical protein
VPSPTDAADGKAGPYGRVRRAPKAKRHSICGLKTICIERKSGGALGGWGCKAHPSSKSAASATSSVMSRSRPVCSPSLSLFLSLYVCVRVFVCVCVCICVCVSVSPPIYISSLPPSLSLTLSTHSHLSLSLSVSSLYLSTYLSPSPPSPLCLFVSLPPCRCLSTHPPFLSVALASSLSITHTSSFSTS